MSALLTLSVLLCVIATCCADQLQLNARATMFHDVESIVHNAERRQVVIELASYRRCNSPSFMVRLSGTSLYLLNLIEKKTDEVGSESRGVVLFAEFERPRPGTYVFSYPPLYDPGTYFLEVMVVYCGGMYPNDFAKLCAEDVKEGHNILTLPYTFEVLANKSNAATTLLHRPRWLLRDEFRNGTSNFTMLATRYQKMGCGKSRGFCLPTQAELSLHNSYEWTDGPDYVHLLTKVFGIEIPQFRETNDARDGGVEKKEPVGDMINFCFVGASHSIELREHANRLNLRNVEFLTYYSQYPVKFKAQELIDMKCSYAVMGYGQWMAGLSGMPFQAHQYKAEIKQVAAKVKWLQRNTNMQIFFRSMNYNGYGARVTACPPVDHRLPPIVDLYNSILRNVTQHAQIEYIDTNHIMGPLWDSALDYQHPKGRVYTAEVQWILHAALNYSISRNQLPTLYACMPLAENDLVRFGGANVIYINKRNKLHAFPSGYNFMGMGLDNIQVLEAHKQKCAVYGPVLRGPKDYQRTEL